MSITLLARECLLMFLQCGLAISNGPTYQVTVLFVECTMRTMSQAGAKWVYVDLARGLAALAVTAGHLRAFVLVDFKDVAQPTLLCRAFYFATSLGEQAVMVFFVMSGFLIGKSVYDNVSTGQWSWSDYAIRRLSRLWTVLVPALIITAMLDYIGVNVVHGALYTGVTSDIYNSTPLAKDIPAIYRADTFFANVFFLQTIIAPTFGTDLPLWSLSNEFWYYVIFPLGFLAVWGKGLTLQRICYATVAAAVCIALPFGMVLYGIVWLFGFGVALVSRSKRDAPQPVALSLSLLLFILTLVVAKLNTQWGAINDFACGAAFAITLYFLVSLKTRNSLITRFARTSAGFSYTLYLTHFPMLALLVSAFLDERKYPPTMGGVALYCFLLLAVTLYSYTIYLLFEHHTEWVRQATYRCSRAYVRAYRS